MYHIIRLSKAAVVRLGFVALLLRCACLTGMGADTRCASRESSG